MKKICGIKADNNEGFSLVELLVAVIILGLIVTPLLHTFVTGTVTAAKSRKVGDATLAAQNISETVEAQDMPTLLNVSNSPYGGTITLNQNDNGTGVFIREIEGISSGKSKFNARVTFDPQKGAADSQYATINAQQIANYSNMDAIFAQSQSAAQDPDKIAMSKFSTQTMNIAASDKNVNVNRQINMTVNYSDGKIMASLSYDYTYYYTASSVDSSGNTTTSAAIWKDSEQYTLFPNGFTVTGGKMPNIYLLYNPWYMGSFSDAETGIKYTRIATEGKKIDTITILNTEDIPFTVFLVKQMTAEATAENETNYGAIISLNESSRPEAEAKIYSNAHKNLVTSEISDQNITGVSFRLQTGTYKYYPRTSSTTGDLVSKTVQDRIYQVKIEIFREGTVMDSSAQPMYTLTTTKLT